MIGFIGISLQLQSIIPAHNPLILSWYNWLSNTRSIPYWTANIFSSVVTDLVLIYDSVTSSCSAVRWLPLHNSTELSYECRIFELSLSNESLVYIWRRTEERSLTPILRLLLGLLFGAGKCSPNRCPAMVIFVTVFLLLALVTYLNSSSTFLPATKPQRCMQESRANITDMTWHDMTLCAGWTDFCSRAREHLVSQALHV
jgi:hypothetical protein